VFERYNIVSGEDLKQAAEKQAVYLDAQHGQAQFQAQRRRAGHR
jgi:hypothetical protein